MGTSASFALARKIAACLSAALLSFALMPASALAGEDIAGPSVEDSQEANSAHADKAAGASAEADGSTSADSSAEAETLAASLMGRPASFVNADVALDGEPIIGSFTVDGLTFAVSEGSNVELVGVSNSEAIGSTLAAPDAEAEGSASEVTASIVALPESVAYNDAEYAVTSIGAYAFYLSGVMSVELPASIANVDDRAFRSSDVASVEVAAGNPVYSSFDGALYDADQSSLLLIPEGKQGAVLLPKETEVAEAGKFSHCSLVDAISAEDGAAFASENGLLYTSDLTTLLRVTAGATEITIREGCTTIAAGAMEGCAKLTAINAPASVTSISPDVFTSVPTVSLPAASIADDETEGEDEVEGDAGTSPRRVVVSNQGLSMPLALSDSGSASPSAEASDSASTQLSALVALSSTDDNLIDVDPSAISVMLPEEAENADWMHMGFNIAMHRSSEGELAQLTQGLSSRAGYYDMVIVPNGHAVTVHGVRHNDATGKDDIDFGKYTITDVTTFTRERWRVMGEEFFALNRTGLDASWEGWRFYGAVQGWTLFGWSQTPDGVLLSDMNEVGSPITVYARWRPNTYTIAFNANGGSGAVPGSISATYDQSYSITSPSLTRAGYKLDGWATSARGDKVYEKSGPFKNLTASDGGTVTLYAHWSLYNCTYTPGDLVTSTTVRNGWRNTSTGADTDTGTETLTGAKAYGGTDLYGTGEATIALYQGDKGVDGRLYYSYFTPVPKAGYSVTGWWRGSASSLVPDWQSYWFTSDAAFGPVVTANSYTVEYWNKAGTTKLSSDTGFKYDTARNLAAKPTTGVNAGYTAVGWATSANQSTATYAFSSSQKNLATSGTKKLYLAETANPITLTWNSNGGSAVASTTQTYSPTAKLALPANPSKAGYTFAGWWTAATGGVQVTSSTALPTANTTYYAHWSLNPYSITYDLAGGAVSGNPTTYDVTTTTFTLKNPTRTGYVFTGWSGTGLSGEANMTVSVAKGSTGNRSYTAHWLPAISADIPLEVTAQVDLLGIEEQQEATGYIESRCGEPLTVAAIELSPLSGATELFGAANVADVSLEVRTDATASPDATFTLDAFASKAPATPAAFRMASYGSRVPISYRFDIPEALLPTLVETTKPVCSVAYTVALA